MNKKISGISAKTWVRNKRLNCITNIIKLIIVILNSDWMSYFQSCCEKQTNKKNFMMHHLRSFSFWPVFWLSFGPTLSQTHPVRCNCPKVKPLDIWMSNVFFFLPAAIKDLTWIKSALQPSLVSACNASCVDFPWSQTLAQTIALSSFNVICFMFDWLVTFELKIFHNHFFQFLWDLFISDLFYAIVM